LTSQGLNELIFINRSGLSCTKTWAKLNIPCVRSLLWATAKAWAV